MKIWRDDEVMKVWGRRMFASQFSTFFCHLPTMTQGPLCVQQETIQEEVPIQGKWMQS